MSSWAETRQLWVYYSAPMVSPSAVLYVSCNPCWDWTDTSEITLHGIPLPLHVHSQKKGLRIPGNASGSLAGPDKTE